jgi:hypothetical protein
MYFAGQRRYVPIQPRLRRLQKFSIPAEVAAHESRPVGGCLFQNARKLFAGEFPPLLVGRGGFGVHLPRTPLPEAGNGRFAGPPAASSLTFSRPGLPPTYVSSISTGAPKALAVSALPGGPDLEKKVSA